MCTAAAGPGACFPTRGRAASRSRLQERGNLMFFNGLGFPLLLGGFGGWLPQR